MLSDDPAAVFLQRAWTCPVSTSPRHPWRVSGARPQPLWGSWTSPSSSGGKNQHAEAQVWSDWVSESEPFFSSSSKNIVYSCRAVINSAATLGITAKMSFVKGAQIWSRPLTIALYDAGLWDRLCCDSERCCVLKCVCVCVCSQSNPPGLCSLCSAPLPAPLMWPGGAPAMPAADCATEPTARTRGHWLVRQHGAACPELVCVCVCLTLGLGGESDLVKVGRLLLHLKPPSCFVSRLLIQFLQMKTRPWATASQTCCLSPRTGLPWPAELSPTSGATGAPTSLSGRQIRVTRLSSHLLWSCLVWLTII